ncbi:hypothetical protein BO94DRAFT_566000 [Aspergillus sclerotioniger CBS 115572]|uniref:Aminoglycoside phosphotransferase domain-containing protein n=1 Tax=Aspergillus sclerotioniger CBS 115572 TaxID=1450535 RepID=A0A317WLA8_9EURO|nr:hypothetical protein BO94DRAFT_566000 [Aspergillus sclerotioniger CBS 115572]PWY87109.1 hypothetical protein BO94DRAFT_566000 [Aspergillus sclerotioniger CBS 115572]
MDCHRPVVFVNTKLDHEWLLKLHEARSNGTLFRWATTLHPRSLPCSSNQPLFRQQNHDVVIDLTFSDQTIWVLRFPRPAGVSSRYVDEKVVMQVEALHLIRQRTEIPVPDVHAWGLAKDNQFGLGPYLLTSFADGIPLSEVWGEEGYNNPKILKDNIPDAQLEYMQRQMARVMLQLYAIDFERIGSLPTSITKFPSLNRPLTRKANFVLLAGDVDILAGFTTTREYLEFLHHQDWQQLELQKNSATSPEVTKSRYAGLKILQTLLGAMTDISHNEVPFKLSVMVRSQDDLTITGIVTQLFPWAPWWVLRSHPMESAAGLESHEALQQDDPFFQRLERYTRFLVEEEARTVQNGVQLSQLMASFGAMWFYPLLTNGFLDPLCLHFRQLRAQVGASWWDKEVERHKSGEEVEGWVVRNINNLEEYNTEHIVSQECEHLLQEGTISSKEYVDLMMSTIRLDPGENWHHPNLAFLDEISDRQHGTA